MANVTIVGMKYHTGSFDEIIAASKRKPKDQRLFLVRDVHNKFDENAVMLHNGQKKLGYVSAVEAKAIRKILDELTVQEGLDQVLVVKMSAVRNEGDFSWVSSFTVFPIGHVYERIARKFAQGD